MNTDNTDALPRTNTKSINDSHSGKNIILSKHTGQNQYRHHNIQPLGRRTTTDPIALQFERDLQELSHTLEEENPIPISQTNPRVIGTDCSSKTAMAEVCDRSRALWIIDSGAQTRTKAMETLGIQPIVSRESDEVSFWQDITDTCNLTTLQQRLERANKTTEQAPEWILIPLAQDYQSDERRAQLEELITKRSEEQKRR
jgi:hypothetical protein